MENSFFDFDIREITLPNIICKENPRCKSYERDIKFISGKKEYYIIGKKLIEDTITYKYSDMKVLVEFLKVGEFVYNNVKRNIQKEPEFKKTDEEAIILGEAIIKLCKKIGMPEAKKSKFEIYDFSYFCYKLYCKFMAWLNVTNYEDVEKANHYLYERYSEKEDIKECIIPLEVWDYAPNSINLKFCYDKNIDKLSIEYICTSLKEVALLQFILLYLSEDGLTDCDGRIMKIKICSICHNQFATFDGKQKICHNHTESEKARIRKQKSRKNL